MKKTYILDTSVLVDNPKILENLPNSEIILPINVVEELDKLKKFKDEIGKNARMAVRKLDQLSQDKDLNAGIQLKNKSVIKVESSFDKSYLGEDSSYNDNKILACVQGLSKTNENVVLLTKDLNLRIRARSLGLKSEDLKVNKEKLTEFYSGFQEVENAKAYQCLMEVGNFSLKKFKIKAFPNENLLFKDQDGNELCLARVTSDGTQGRLVRQFSNWGITPKNNAQTCAMDMINDPNISLVSLMGIAGSGKTLISLASCLELVLNKRKYDKLIIYRPIETVGKDLGFLPGSLEEKMDPLFSAIYDSFEILFNFGEKQKSKGNRKDITWKEELDVYIKKGLIELSVISYARGRSIPNALILIDEAQNMNRHSILTLLTRLSEGSKAILVGDIDQIDTKDLDAGNNALVDVVESFKDSTLAGHINLTEGLRSPLANEAIVRLG